MRGTISYGIEQDEMLYMPNIVNVRAMGAVGNGILDDARAIQRAFDFLKDTGGTILFPIGTYLITTQVFFYSNQKIVFEKGAKLLQGYAMDNLMMNYSTSTTGAYDATENVEIVGGIFDGGSYTTNNTLLGVCHAKNIKITDCTFVNAYGSWHNLEINACKNVVIDGCRFDGSRKTSSNGCLIQIDNFTSTATWPWGNGLVDNTVCYLVEIRGCYFYNSTAAPAIGNHSPAISNAIRIHGNTFENITSSRGAINFANATNVDVHNNTFIDCTTGVIVGTADGTNLVHNNRFVGVSNVSNNSCNADSNMVNGTLVTDDNYVTADDLKSLAYKDVISESDLDASLTEKLNNTGGASVQADWDETDTTSPAYIKNKPTISGDGGASVQSNWAQTDDTQPDYIKNKPAIPSVEGLATESYVDEKISEINVQGGASGSVSWEDIEDKPFGEIVTQTDVLPMGRFDNFVLDSQFGMLANAVGLGNYHLTIGDHYKISWDGQVYDCEALDVSALYQEGSFAGMGNGTAFGYTGNDEPFIIVCRNDIGYLSLACLTHTSSDPCEYHDVRIYKETSETKKIDAEFLPDDIGGDILPEVSAEDNGKVLGVVDGEWKKIAVGGDGSVAVQPDWNQSDDSAADYIKNRPFYDYKGEVDIVPNRTCDSFTLDSSYNVYTSAVSGTISLIPGQSYKVLWDGNEFECEATEVTGDLAAAMPGSIIIGNGPAFGLAGNDAAPFIIGTSEILDATVYISLTDTSEGVAHEIRVWQEKTLAKKIDARYLPIPFFGDTYQTLFENTFVEEVNIGGERMGEAMLPGEWPYTLNIGQTYAVEWDGVVYQCDAMELQGCAVLGNTGVLDGNDNGIPFAMVYDPSGDLVGYVGWAVTIVEPNDSGTYHCVISGDVTTKIDAKYIYQPDWDEPDRHSGSYIKNRPFGTLKAGTKVVPMTHITCDSQFVGSLFGCMISPVGFIPGVSYSFICDGITHTFTAEDQSGMTGYLDEENGYAIFDNVDGSGLSIILVPEAGDHEYMVVVAEDAVTKIDPKYLPGSYLPEVTADHNGQVMTVVDGVWTAQPPASGLPEVTTSDAGKFLRVSADGVWVAESIQNAEEASF